VAASAAVGRPSVSRLRAFYSYAYPAPDGIADQPIGPEGAYFSTEFQQYLLPYEAARTTPDPDNAVAEFLHTTYQAAAERGHWDRPARTTPSGGTEPLCLGETTKPDRPTTAPVIPPHGRTASYSGPAVAHGPATRGHAGHRWQPSTRPSSRKLQVSAVHDDGVLVQVDPPTRTPTTLLQAVDRR
jgi:hypothetical protein